MKSFKAAVIQMNSQPDVDHNLDQAYQLLKEAAKGGARLVGLPENFAFLGNLKKRMQLAGTIAEKAHPFLKQTAKELGIYLLGGSYPAPADESNGKTYNRSVLFGPDGKERARYDKVHLFDVDLPNGESYRESDYVKPGVNNPVVCKTDICGIIGMSICYDLRFPELYRKLSEQQSDMLCVPSAFTETTGRAHWKPLLRARAIENTAYVFAPAQTGKHGEKRRTYGHALIADPWGRIIADAGKQKGFAIAEIDATTIKQVRAKIPSLQHRVFK